jgi:glycosyltransferase involved in cell wall biosynthesis
VNEAPSFSVIVVAYNAEGTIRACLEALERQTERDFELIVVDSSKDRTAEIVAHEFPFARLLRSVQRLAPGAARNHGISVATGDVIAFVDSDCIARPDWLAILRRAHRELPAAAIGGAVEPANPESVVSWGAYFCEFSAWMPQGERRLMREIPTCNLSFKRWALEQFGPFDESGYCSDTALNWKLTAAGHPPLFLPELRVAHFNLTRLTRFLRKQVMHGESFARMRCRERSLRLGARALLGAGTPLLPGLFLGRLVLRLAGSSVWQRWLRSLPVVLVGFCAWSCGEAIGYVKAH